MQIGRKIIRLESVDSTNNYIANLLKVGELSNGTVILSDEQFAGRGQRDAEWLTKPGENLTFSFFIDNVNLSVHKQFYLTFVVSLALVELLKKFGIEAKIKWPNDIYVREQKIAGVLIENQLSGASVKNSIIGIGLNINQLDFGRLNATSIRKEIDVQKVPMDVLYMFIEQFNSSYENFSESMREELKSNYLKSLFQFNEIHCYEDVKGEFKGEIVNVLDSGHLEIRRETGIHQYDLKEIKFIL